MTFTVKAENLEIRGYEEKQGKNGEYAVVRFDAENGDRLEFVDRNKDRFDYYKKGRGKMCDIWLKVTSTPKYTNFEIVKMEYISGDGSTEE